MSIKMIQTENVVLGITEQPKCAAFAQIHYLYENIFSAFRYFFLPKKKLNTVYLNDSSKAYVLTTFCLN